MTIDTTKLRELAQKADTDGHRMSPDVVMKLLDAIDVMTATMCHMRAELEKLRTIEVAARNLVKVKGRHHSEIAMDRLIEALR